MACPKCGNFMAARADGGICHSQCISCGYGEVVKGLVVHTSRHGNVQQSESSSGKEYEMALENLSYDETLLQLSDKLCPTCGSKARVWLSQTHLYIYLCPRCHKVIHPK